MAGSSSRLERVYYPYQSTWKDLALKNKKRGIQKTETRLLATATGPPTPSARKERAGAGKIEAIQIVELQPQVKEKHCKDEALGLAKWECLTKSLLHILKRYIYYKPYSVLALYTPYLTYPR